MDGQRQNLLTDRSGIACWQVANACHASRPLGITLLVACNFSPEPCRWAPPKRVLEAETRLLLANAGEPRLAESMTLEPWQAAVWAF